MNNYLTVKELPENERPYEKCEKYGASVLSDAELLAVIIKSGTPKERSIDLAKKLLNQNGTNRGLHFLYHTSFNELRKIHGIGKVKAVQLLCVAELSKRIAEQTRIKNISFEDSEKVAGFFMESMRHLEQEHLVIVLLDSRNNLICHKTVFTGTVGMAPMEPRELLREALRNDAVYFIVLHNHPSGDPTPSSQDITSTKRLAEAGNAIGIRLLDHIIIGDNKYASLKKAGIF